MEVEEAVSLYLQQAHAVLAGRLSCTKTRRAVGLVIEAGSARNLYQAVVPLVPQHDWKMLETRFGGKSRCKSLAFDPID